MVNLRNKIHPRGLPLSQQRLLYVRRTVHKESWRTIAPQLERKGGQKLKVKDWKLCRDTFLRMFDTASEKKNSYANCGRKQALTPANKRWLINRMLVANTTKLRYRFQLSPYPSPANLELLLDLSRPPSSISTFCLKGVA